MLIIARHGQTTLNAEGRLQGRIDPDLNDLGRRQAEQLADRYAANVDRVITSPLQRARQTAAPFEPLRVDVDERWIEIDFGALEGGGIDDVAPAEWQRWREDPDVALGGGESQRSVFKRVRAACQQLAPLICDGQRILVVSHVSAIKAAVTWALGGGESGLLRMRLDQAAVCSIQFLDPETPVLRTFNDTSHLRPE